MYKAAGFILLLLAYALLLPGLNQPMISVTGVVDKNDMLDLGKQMLEESDTKMGFVGDMASVVINSIKVEGTVVAFDKTRSILGTVRDLFDNDNVLVALLIVTFSVLIPLFKGFILLITLLDLKPATRSRLNWFNSSISKWSMADVFVIGIFVAFLAANGLREDSGLVMFSSSLGPGFYYFLGYCLISIAASQLIDFANRTEPKTQKKSAKSSNQRMAKTEN